MSGSLKVLLSTLMTLVDMITPKKVATYKFYTSFIWIWQFRQVHLCLEINQIKLGTFENIDMVNILRSYNYYRALEYMSNLVTVFG